MNGEKKRARLDQRRAPIHQALENFRQMRVVPLMCPVISGAAATRN